MFLFFKKAPKIIKCSSNPGSFSLREPKCREKYNRLLENKNSAVEKDFIWNNTSKFPCQKTNLQIYSGV